MPPIIELRNVHKVYSNGDLKVHAVKGVTLTVEPGEFIAVMGASGSGKSTLMNILGCLDQPTDGEYLLDGVAIARLSREELAEIRSKMSEYAERRITAARRAEMQKIAEWAEGGAPEGDAVQENGGQAAGQRGFFSGNGRCGAGGGRPLCRRSACAAQSEW